MTPTPPDPSLTQQVKLDGICMRFEQNLREGEEPRIESYLEGFEEAQRATLLSQLLLLELEYLQAELVEPSIETYLGRFPKDPTTVHHAFEVHAAAAASASPAPEIEATQDQPAAERVGTQIDRYKLLEQIGEGGMGVVYMAEQQRPVRRKVALKIIKPGMDTKQVVARFEAERQALAMMDHPNIARVLDAGSTESRRSLRDRSAEEDASIGGAIGDYDSGRPYFVMELVRGTTITEYCDANKLDTNARLKLFKSVCQAVQHAHTKGIIHRDLKPSNVMVTLHDGEPVPKIIDFGVSKAMGQQLTDKTMFTAFAQMVGTPLYMSPEQAEMSGLDIDTRSDIYSLGVLLYELLTGSTPFDRKRLVTAGFDEMRRIIREEEPERPSTRVSTADDSSVTVSERRSTDPNKLKQLLRGELDWIVMKTLEKDRNRRYETANAIVAELDRYLAGEPVSACPPSATYRLRKFASRYRSQVMVATGFAALLVVSSIVAWYLYADARIARNDAVAAKDNVTVERDRAVAAEQEAAQNLQQATQERDRAEAEKRRADQKSDELKERLYDYNLTKADAAQREGNLAGMQSLLADCLEDQRGWEWYRLARLVPRFSEQELDGKAQVLAVNSVMPHLAIGYLDGVIQLRDDTTGEVLWEKTASNQYVTDLEFSPDGTRLAVSHASQNLHQFGGTLLPDVRSGLELWDSATGETVWEQSLDPGAFGMVTFSPDGQRVVTFSGRNIENSGVDLRNAETGEVIWTAPALGLPFSLVFSPDGQRLYLSFWTSMLVHSPSTLACWNVNDHRQLWSIERSASSAVAIADKGTRLVTGGANHSIQIWRADTGDKLEEIHANFGGKDAAIVALSQDGSRLVSRCHDRITIWDWKTKKALRSRRMPLSGNLMASFFCRNGHRVASLDNLPGGKIQFFDAEPEQPESVTLVGHERELRCLAFGPNGELVSVGVDGTLRSWNPRSGQETSVRIVATNAKTVAYSPDGKYVATGGEGGAKLWETNSGRLVHQWSDIGDVFWLAFDAEGNRLAAGGREKILKVWSVEDGKTLIAHQTQGFIDGLEIDDDHNLVVVLGSHPGTIETVNLTSGEAKVLKASGSAGWRARCLRRLPESSIVAAGIQDAVEFWDVNRGIQTQAIQTSATTKSFFFNHDATRLFIGDDSGVVSVWNVESRAQLLSWKAHDAMIYSMVLSPDGRTLVTAGSDGLIKLWITERLALGALEERRVVREATTKVNQLYHQSGALRDVMAALTNDESLSKEVRRIAMEVATARGDRPRGPMQKE